MYFIFYDIILSIKIKGRKTKKIVLYSLLVLNTGAFAYTSEIVDGYIRDNGEVVQPYIRYRNDNEGFYNPSPIDPPSYIYDDSSYGEYEYDFYGEYE